MIVADEVDENRQLIGVHRWSTQVAEPDDTTPGYVRQWIREHLEKVGVDAYAAMLAGSELATNGERHAGTDLWITLYVDQRHTVIGVGDHAPDLPLRRSHADDDWESGRGLDIIGNLGALRVDTRRPGTKRAIAVLDTIPARIH
jgi:hypothetical protein